MRPSTHVGRSLLFPVLQLRMPLREEGADTQIQHAKRDAREAVGASVPHPGTRISEYLAGGRKQRVKRPEGFTQKALIKVDGLKRHASVELYEERPRCALLAGIRLPFGSAHSKGQGHRHLHQFGRRAPRHWTPFEKRYLGIASRRIA